MKLTSREAIIQALVARGEQPVHDASLSKYDKWTRRYLGLRDECGRLRPVPPGHYWFLSRRGASVRYGTTSTGSRAIDPRIRQALANEGRGKALAKVPDVVKG